MKNKKTTKQKETAIPEIPVVPTIPVVPEVKVQTPASVKRSHHKDDSDITWALMLIVGGILLLLNNAGILPWAIWGVLWRFWPVLFILWGLQLIAGKSLIGKIFMFTVTLLTLCGVAGFAVLLHDTELRDRVNNQFPALQLGKLESFNTKKETVNEKILRGEFSNVERHKVNLSFNEGKFIVTDVLGGEWVTVGGEIQKPRVSFSLNSEEKLSTLTTNIALKTENFLLIAPETSHLNINLGTPEISTDLSLSMTSGKGEVTLNDLNARTISLDMTSGTVTMKLNEKSIPKESFVVDMTSGDAEIHIPKNVGIRVTHDITSGNLQVGEIRVTKEGVFTSDNFETAEKKLEMRFDMTSGRVKIIRD